MAEYALTSEEMRTGREAYQASGTPMSLAVWLAAHDAEVRARALAEGFSEGVNFIDDQPGPWGAGMVAGRAEAARRRTEVEGVVDL